jgi:hypothetical protein
VVDDAIERGSPAACWSALFVMVALLAGLWFGDFASERVGPAWQAIEREAVHLTGEANIGHMPHLMPDPCGAPVT